MVKCQRCIEEEEAGMACLTCSCSSYFNSTNLRDELTLENLITLDMVQLQNLCARVNLQPWGDRVTLIERLMRRFHFYFKLFIVESENGDDVLQI